MERIERDILRAGCGFEITSVEIAFSGNSWEICLGTGICRIHEIHKSLFLLLLRHGF